MVRPNKPDSERASLVLPPVRVTKQQDDSYRQEAERKGLALATWIKKVLDAEVKGKK